MTTLQNNIESAFKMVTPILVQSGKAENLTKLSKQYEQAKNEPVCILVCGEFKRGKSTFVNALIGRNICATDTDICTSVVSVIKYGPTESVTRFYGDFSNPKSQSISLDDLERYTVGTADEIDNTLYVEICLPLPMLKEGMMIIDTPGVGGLDPRHAALTNVFIPKADIALFMTDVNEPMTTTELGFLKSKVLPYAKQFAIVVNKADLRDAKDVEDFRQDTISKVSSFTQTAVNSIKAISVSSAAEAYPDSDLGESNFTELKKMISALVEEHRVILRKAIKANFIELLDLAIAPLQAQLKQIEQPDIKQIEGLNRRKIEMDKKLAELSDPNSEFRMAVNKEITSQREEIITFLNESSVTLQSEIFNRILHAPEAKSNGGGKWMGQQLNDAIAQIGSETTLRLDRAFKLIAEKPQFEGMLNFATKSYTSSIVIRDVDTSVPVNKRITSLMSGASIMTIGCSLLSGFGMVAALAVGTYVAFKNQRDSSTAYVESNLRQIYQPQMSGAISSLNTYVNSRLTEFQQEWLSIITDRCKAYKASLQESIANIQQVKQAINQAVNMKMQIQNRLKPLITAKEMVNNSPD